MTVPFDLEGNLGTDSLIQPLLFILKFLFQAMKVSDHLHVYEWKVCIYQRSNQKLQVKKGQTIQWPKVKRLKGKQYVQNTT